MKISNFISKELVFLNVEAETIDDLIVDILNKASLVDNELKKNLLNIKETVLKREKEACTALGHGIIIPHGRIENYEDTTVIAGTLKNPIKTIVRNKIEEVDVFFFIISKRIPLSLSPSLDNIRIFTVKPAGTPAEGYNSQ